MNSSCCYRTPPIALQVTEEYQAKVAERVRLAAVLAADREAALRAEVKSAGEAAAKEALERARLQEAVTKV